MKEESEKENMEIGAEIKVGDLSVTITRGSLNTCEKTIKRLLQDKKITGYLKSDSFQKKKILTPTCVG